MSFILKKSRPVIVVIGKEPDHIELHLKRVKASAMLEFLQKNMDVLERMQKSAEAAKDAGEASIVLKDIDIPMLNDIRKIVLDTACGWGNVVDEDGNDVEFTVEALADLVDHSMWIYFGLLNSLTALTDDAREQSDSTKN